MVMKGRKSTAPKADPNASSDIAEIFTQDDRRTKAILFHKAVISMESESWFFKGEWVGLMVVLQSGGENWSDLPKRKTTYHKVVSSIEAADWFLRVAIPVEIRQHFALRQAVEIPASEGRAE